MQYNGHLSNVAYWKPLYIDTVFHSPALLASGKWLQNRQYAQMIVQYGMW